MPDGEFTDYRKAVQALPDEKIVFAWAVWPDRQTGAVAHEGMWVDPRMLAIEEMPMDSKRMILGGFEPIFSYPKDIENAEPMITDDVNLDEEDLVSEDENQFFEDFLSES